MRIDDLPLKKCPSCEFGQLHVDCRDVTIKRGDYSAIAHNISGAFCDHCGEIEFDDESDSAERYADIGDSLVWAQRNATFHEGFPLSFDELESLLKK
jgi:HTH-type transcriptional regulator/antitoxin MqsA